MLSHQLINTSRYVTVEVPGKNLCSALDVPCLSLHRGRRQSTSSEHMHQEVVI